MTREPFIAHSELTNEIYIIVGKEKYRITEQAIKAVMAIKELEQEQKLTRMIDKSDFSQEQYSTDIQSAYDCGKSVLDKIRAEIMAIGNWTTKSELPNEYLVKVLEIIDKYRESEDKE